MKRIIAAMGAALLLAGCATSFSGSTKVDGPDECRKICGKWGMELAGMVAMGDYTDGCICKVKGETLSLRDAGRGLLMSSAATAGGVSAVKRQMEKDD